ncbi:hypothetical protein HPB52_007841 [Rhipicephalus sanguineus]|uniref:DDE Tnp4 domain-containing protein n=1 Tax=Rhipicephalus sanguineus TaxID=34632 RepID=A0A9D4T596_RHISA|nr:hypothetical protein HPB52_007841 [Rhipicephalus sanguineus]
MEALNTPEEDLGTGLEYQSPSGLRADIWAACMLVRRYPGIKTEAIAREDLQQNLGIRILQAVHNRGTPLSNCWGFVYGTARPICHPSVDQRTYFSGHKRVHALKYQAVMGANGIVCELDGPHPGSRHDAG